MASYTLTIYDIPQIINKKYISISYNSNGEKSTCTIHTENRTWICTLQDLSYSKAIYKPGELIFKLQITGCSGVNAICSTFKGKKIELTAQADNKSSSIAKDYYIFGIQIEKKGNVYYATFQAYDPFKFLTLDTYCKAYTGKKFTQDIFLNKDLWPNNLPETIDEQLTIENAQSLKKEREAEKANLEEKQKEINKNIDQYAKGASNGNSKVICCLDSDDYDINMEAIKFLNEAFKFCNDNKYELIWFCKDIERVYLRKKVVKDEKKKEAGKFKANKTIRNIDAKNLVASKYKDGTSNILNILDKYLERK